MSDKTGTTIEEVITRVNELKPNAFTDRQKTEWINKVETAVQTEIMDLEPDELTVYDYSRDHDTELIVKLPYRDIYDFFLMAMIDYMAGDIQSYANSMMMYNAAFDSRAKSIRKKHKNIHSFKNWW